MEKENLEQHNLQDAIAVIGMAGRFPGARNINKFWRNLRDGVESIRPFTPGELQASGIDDQQLQDSDYVNRGAPLEDADCFDAAFFGYTPREAELMDPQHRLFLQSAYAAIQDAGYDPENCPGPVGVFGGVARNTYFLRNAQVYQDLVQQGALYDAMLGSEKDFPATRVSYKLNLDGPSINVQSACSTSGVAVHLACQSLLSGECEMALAGGARVRVPLHAGYVYMDGGIPSPDGYCRAFDADAKGCVYGSGVGVVVLKRLADAIGDGDHIDCLILGSAINNDGARKIGFTAPSVEGQAAVVADALAVADVDASTISYVEAHGTGTTLGDPIEIAALTRAFRESTDGRGYCAIGTLKTNIGHLDAGAGVAGLIKTALALKNKQIPASLNFNKPNPQIDFASSPFYVNDTLRDWQTEGYPRRAGISSFGLGGTNFHAIVQEAPDVESSGPSRRFQLLTLSAKSVNAFDSATSELVEHLKTNPQLNLADVAYTLQQGRASMAYRRSWICQNIDNAIAKLESAGSKQADPAPSSGASVAFMFPGQGAQHVDMGRDLYEQEKVFKDEVDACCETLKPILETDLRDLLYPEPSGRERAGELLMETRYTQPALFVVEYALARLWQSWGIQPQAMIGHSIGEYAAATVAGVFSLGDALKIVAVRGQLMQEQPAGNMLAVSLSDEQVQPFLTGGLALAANNAPELSVVAGPAEEIDSLSRQLADQGVDARILHTSHAFHSSMMEPALEPFLAELRKVNLSNPSIPLISGLTGNWITDAEAQDPVYWAKQLREPVRFSRGITELQKESNRILLEVGPSKTLYTLAKQHRSAGGESATIVSSLRHVRQTEHDLSCMLGALGELWSAGIEIDWSKLHEDQRRLRLSLPTYPFERTRHWLRDKPPVEQTQAEMTNKNQPASPMPAPTTPPATSTTVDRKTVVLGHLKTILCELSGIDAAEIEPSATFLEMGFDSLFLTRANVAFQRKFKVKITFRQLFEEAPTLEALAAYIDRELPPGEFAPPAAAPTVNVATTPAASPAPTVDRKETILNELKNILQELSGIESAKIDPKSTFMEMGFDSLFLTRANVAFQKKFDVKITFRQLFEEAPTLEALASYIERELPDDAIASYVDAALPAEPEPAPSPAVQATTDSRSSGSSDLSSPIAVRPDTTQSGDGRSYEALLEQHLAATTQLLNKLRQGTQPALESGRTTEPKSGITIDSRRESALNASVPRVSHGPFKPLDSGNANSLTESQKERLDAFIARYTKRTATSKKLAAQNRSLLADPRSVAGFKSVWKEAVYPIHTIRSDGSRIWDVDGNEYVDFVMGFGASLFGHRPPFVVEAVKAQLDAGFETGPIHPMAGEVARLVQELTGAERVGFCSTGSEAVLAAIRVARTVTARDKIVIFDGAYHGIFDEVLARSLIRNGELRSMPTAPGIPDSSLGEIIVLQYGNPESLKIIEQYGEEIAAVLVEPVQSRRLDLVPRDFLLQLREITAATDTALVFDEVVTGFRVEPGGAQAFFGIDADLTTYGKVVGGGLPIGIVSGKSMYMDALDGGHWQFGDDSAPVVGVTFFAGTFVRHPLALAAAKSVLTHLKQEGPGLQIATEEKAVRTTARCRELFARYNAPYQLTQFSSLMHLQVPAEFTWGGLLFYHLRDRGIHIFENRVFVFTTAHTEEDSDQLLAAMQSSLEEMRNDGFLPTSAGSSAAGATGVRSTDGVPLTAAQEEIWLAASFSDELNCSYNQPLSMRFRGELNLDAMRAALTNLVKRHDALRMVFDKNGEYQQVQAPWMLDVPLHDLRAKSQGDQQQALDELREREATTPFDLVNGPLVRACIIRVAEQEHLLFLTVHHVVGDGFSCGVLVHELGEFYSATQERREPNLDEPASFVEYAFGEASRSGSAEAQQIEDFWVNRLHNPPPVVELPLDLARPELKTFPADRVNRKLDAELVRLMSTTAAKEGCSVFTWLFAAFTAFLERLSGQDDMVVAIVAADQAMTGQHNLVGHTANLLPIRIDVNCNATFRDHLTDVKRHMLDAFERKDITFGSLIKKLRLARDPSRLPLVSIVLNMDPDHADARFEGLTADIGTNPRRFENFDWFFNVIRGPERLEFECTYNTDLFTAESVRDRLQQFETLIRGFLDDTANRSGSDSQNSIGISNTNIALGQIPLVVGNQLEKMLVQWNATQRDYPDRCVHDLFSEQVQRSPNRTAVSAQCHELTYAELDRKSNQLANCLAAKGVGPGGLVALCTERTPEMVVGLLGILKTGAAYVPIDPNFPPDRIAFMLEDSNTEIAVAHHALLDQLPATRLDIVELDNEFSDWSDAPLHTDVTSEQDAYLIYTSGSTGRPKGVQISHRAFVNFLHSMQNEPGMTADDICLAVTTLSFDIAGLELFLPLICGGQVEIATAEEAADADRLIKLLVQSEATIMQATPVSWRMMLEAGWQGSRNLKILCGGEALPRDIIGPLLKRCKELWNMYGPTETTVWSSIERIKSADEVISVGQPVDNTQMYVLDEWFNPVPCGVPGELYIGGDGLARGYLGRPELTQEKFIPNPLHSEAQPTDAQPTDRIYRTGDMARYLPDGRIECLGRVDHQVKIRGFRIELGEIEAVLSMQPQIHDSAVVAREFSPGDVRLVAYVVYSSDAAVNFTELQATLRDKLPNYMVPSSVVVLDELPHTPNGKIDRKSLVNLDVGASRAEESYQAPKDQIELHLSRLWEDLLDVRHVGVSDDFFDLGGHSLLGVQLMVRIEETYGKRLPLATLLQTTTVGGLADILRSGQWQPNWDCLVPIRAGGSKPPLFLIHAAGGNVLIYNDLARHLSDEQPVYGVQAQGLDGEQALHTSVEEMATAYRQEIQELQPSGPYLLGGYCLGGTIAFEVATQLFEQGEHVAFLGMLDAHNWANLAQASFFGRCRYYLQKVDFHLRNLWRLPSREKRLFFRGKMSELRRRKAVWNDTVMPKGNPVNGSPPSDRSLSALWANNDRIAAEYRPRSYPGRITHFCPVSNYSELSNADVGWENIAQGGVDVNTLPVYPAGMLLEPYVKQLALEMTEAIEQSLVRVSQPVAPVRQANDSFPALQPVS